MKLKCRHLSFSNRSLHCFATLKPLNFVKCGYCQNIFIVITRRKNICKNHMSRGNLIGCRFQKEKKGSPHSDVPTMAHSQSLRSFWIVFRKKFPFFLNGCLRSSLQLALFLIFFIYFGLPLIEKYDKKEVTKITLQRWIIHSKSDSVCGSAFQFQKICGKSA